MGPVLGKTRIWGWGTVFDLVPFCWGGINKHFGGGELRAKPGIESAKRPRIGAKLESRAQPEIEWGRSLGRGWLSPSPEKF